MDKQTQTTTRSKRPYQPPKLVRYGTLTAVTGTLLGSGPDLILGGHLGKHN